MTFQSGRCLAVRFTEGHFCFKEQALELIRSTESIIGKMQRTYEPPALLSAMPWTRFSDDLSHRKSPRIHDLLKYTYIDVHTYTYAYSDIYIPVHPAWICKSLARKSAHHRKLWAAELQRRRETPHSLEQLQTGRSNYNAWMRHPMAAHVGFMSDQRAT